MKSEQKTQLLPLDICRKLLGNVAKSMTDAEIEDLRNIFIVIADLAIDSYLQKKKKKI